ncbi:helix-turn-helix domain-containing protein [Paraburkholderia sp. CNPSo 3272]|uniref:helix-turn-helix domain-containing protein n=1 Tax=Paraburkholderia sp. CNPSo 3272 TaxID=2940931 RepID=UPI0020B7B1B6|nr:helix-turn-helix transcriptional regulator [Paraburkholderia sp. CNPSo 3272]MCP3722376.1 helix-turn-helix domain-containing protein [Paraburkholderia sp. CNPSo 3272]
MSSRESTSSKASNLAALLAEAAQSDDFDFELKAQEVAVNLASLMLHAGLSRAALARQLNWKPARLSKVLGGEENLTLRTLYLIYKALGYTFDVVPRAEDELAPMQPWQRFSFDNEHVQTADIKLEEKPRVPSVGSRPEDAWPEWLSRSQEKYSQRVDLIAANMDFYDAALAS